jgi:hypothetical protein
LASAHHQAFDRVHATLHLNEQRLVDSGFNLGAGAQLYGDLFPLFTKIRSCFAAVPCKEEIFFEIRLPNDRGDLLSAR